MQLQQQRERQAREERERTASTQAKQFGRQREEKRMAGFKSREKLLFTELRQRRVSEEESAKRRFFELREDEELTELAREKGDVRILLNAERKRRKEESELETLRTSERMKDVFTHRELETALEKNGLGHRTQLIKAAVDSIAPKANARAWWTPNGKQVVLNPEMFKHVVSQSKMRTKLLLAALAQKTRPHSLN